jgi:hypothetical protein
MGEPLQDEDRQRLTGLAREALIAMNPPGEGRP